MSSVESVCYPTAWVRINLTLEDFGQPGAQDPVLLPSAPLKAKVTKNPFLEADTFEVTVDFEDFPLDPRIVVGGTCEVFMAAAEGLDPDFWERQSIENMRRFALISGVIDHIKGGIGPEGRHARLSGRDYTAYFLDVETEAAGVSFIDPSGKKLSLVEIIQKLIDQRGDLTKEISIRSESPDVFPADYKQRADDPKTGKRRKKEGEVLWEVLQELALEAGLVVYVDLDEIVIRKPSTIFVDEGADPSTWYRWRLGENLFGFHPERDMGRQQGINVKVTSYVPDEKKVLSSIFPKDPLAAKKADQTATAPAEEKEGQKKPRVVFRPYVVQGITDQARLDDIAEQLYELVRHHELEAKFTTGEMVDSEGREIWRIGYGDPVTIDVSDSLKSLVSLDPEEMVRRLVERAGYPPERARNVALAINSLGVPFYFHSVTYDFGAEDGVGFKMTAELRSRKQVEIDATDLQTDTPGIAAASVLA